SYYRLSNLAGQLLSEAWITGTTITIDLSAYKTGVYMLTIALNGKTESWKIVKK
ncbi:MAG: T9SS type A sorting domain-containing protein, partial [Bacteroidales bacterium]|nr:T9SS type A sorting domain-containing protein [Bacteroidales bacterium]